MSDEITIEEARKTLGPEYDRVSDEDMQKLIDRMYRYCHTIIDWHMKHPGEGFLKGTPKESREPEPSFNKERHLANKMPIKATLDQKIKRHIEHVVHCKCRQMPDKIKKEIQKRIL